MKQREVEKICTACGGTADTFDVHCPRFKDVNTAYFRRSQFCPFSQAGKEVVLRKQADEIEAATGINPLKYSKRMYGKGKKKEAKGGK